MPAVSAESDNPISYEMVEESANYILNNSKHRPKIGVICGSGLGSLADQVKEADIFDYEDIPNFPVSTVEGHKGRLLVGTLSDIPIIVMQGRFHSYEGYELWKTAMPVRVMKIMGVDHLIATNAGGGLNKAFQVGDIMVLKDHINLPGFSCQHPLRGPNDTRFGPRFFPLNELYNVSYRKMAKKLARGLGLEGIVREGVYAMVGGPNYETVAELKMLRELGVDSVGMSTIPETIVAHHCGMKVFACSLITNLCIVEYETGQDTNHEEVIEVGKRRANDLKQFVEKLVVEISKS
jgi:purine-nucleoside phosphorylase